MINPNISKTPLIQKPYFVIRSRACHDNKNLNGLYYQVTNLDKNKSKNVAIGLDQKIY